MLACMDFVAVIMDMYMFLFRKILPQYLDAPCKQHNPDQKFHRESQMIGNDKRETNYSNSNKYQSSRVANTPKAAHQKSCREWITVLADYR